MVWNIVKDILNLLGILGAAGGALWFGYKQTRINQRLQEIQDYVALSIVPQPNLQLRIMNVGRINLYVHKWEIGKINETYPKPILIPAGGPSFLLISVSAPIGQHPVKIYLTDEKEKKYLSTGEVIIEPISVHTQPLSVMEPKSQEEIHQDKTGIMPISPQKLEIHQVNVRMRAWSYKTEPYEWKI